MKTKTIDPEIKYIDQDVSFFLAQNDLAPIKQPEKLISKWIDGRRIMPPGSPFEGIYSIMKTPYIVEICNNMSPFSKVRHQAVKKGVQVAFTTALENMIGYYIGERPTKIMYMSATDDLTELFSTDRLDPLIDSCDLRGLISDQSEAVNSRKTGDKTKYKQFPGGSLVLTSAQSAAKMRAMSIKILIRDEIDGAPTQLTTGEGNFLSVSEGRLEAFGDRAKITDGSTPTLRDESAIDDQYKRGDHRKFMVRCPMCEKYQFLTEGSENSKYGLKGDYKAGQLQQGYYLCDYCHDAIFDYHKGDLLASGHWEPTQKALDKNFRSYHLPSFYSPPGMTSFTKIRAKWDEALEVGDDALRSVVNLYFGKSFAPTGQRPKFKSVIEIRSGYNSGTVPTGIMYLTAAGDVQRGKEIYHDVPGEEIERLSEKYKKSGDTKKLEGIPRIEVEVIGHGAEFRTASIIYKTFYGRIDDDKSGAWLALWEWGKETGLVFKRKDGFQFNVKRFLIDSGDGMYTDLVYSFCERFPGAYACKGDKTPKQDKLKLTKIDEMSASDFRRFKLSKSGTGDHTFVLIYTNYYKQNIYRILKKTGWEGEQPPNTHQTPSDYPDSYFKGLTAEEHRTDGSFHNPQGRRNEPLDLLVYNKAAADMWIDGLIMLKREALKREWKKRGRNLSVEELRKLANRKTITAQLEAELKEKGW